MKEIKKALYLDAMALVPGKKSGVGVTIERTLEQLLKNPSLKNWEINLVVTLGKAKYISKYSSANVHIKTIFLPARVLEVFSRTGLLLPIDWFLGNGVYVFPNYRNLPLWHSRSITYVYDIAYIKYPETVQVKNQKYLNKFMPGWVRRTDRVVTISKQVKYEIEKYLGLSESRIDIVPCGVDRSVFYKRDTAEIEAAKNTYSIPYDKYFLFVGNIEPRKNLEKLLDAYDSLPPTIQKQYGLVFVGGNGWQNDAFYKKLTNMQQQNKNVYKVSKYVESTDLPALLSGASLLIHPAIYEGFGITPLEAMACGTPVAVADVPSIREVVKDAGIYFDPNDVQAMAGAISQVLTQSNAVADNIVRGLAIATDLSWQNAAQELYKIIVIEQKLGPPAHPILTRLRFAVETVNKKALRILGEKEALPYVPAYAKTAHEMHENILKDFMSMQPTRLQVIAKKIYLGVKHATFVMLRKVYRTARG